MESFCLADTRFGALLVTDDSLTHLVYWPRNHQTGHVKLDKSLTVDRSKRRDLCFSSALMTTLVVSGTRLTWPTLSAPPLMSQFWILTKLLIKRKMMPTNFRTSSGVSSRRRTFGSLHADIVAKENGGAGLRLPHQRHGLGCGNRVKCKDYTHFARLHTRKIFSCVCGSRDRRYSGVWIAASPLGLTSTCLHQLRHGAASEDNGAQPTLTLQRSCVEDAGAPSSQCGAARTLQCCNVACRALATVLEKL